jgi:periplasmic copper chaperone A
MKKYWMLVLTGILFLSACDGEGTDIEAHDYWARAALKGENSAFYMLMHNHSGVDDELVSVSSDVAAAAEIHRSEMGADGVVQMVPQAFVPLPVDSETSFEPGGLHVMLVGLIKDINVDDKITVTLHFKNHEDIILTVPVLDVAEMGGSGMDGHTP